MEITHGNTYREGIHCSIDDYLNYEYVCNNDYLRQAAEIASSQYHNEIVDKVEGVFSSSNYPVN
jgi:hypothetical protein